MNWQTILIIVIAVLLLLMWLPALYISVRDMVRDFRKREKNDINNINNKNQ